MAQTEELSKWIGKTDKPAIDIITPRVVDGFKATFSEYVADLSEIPLGVQWCLSPPMAPTELLGLDGHPAKGGFLPPIPLPRRMWAGGKVEFIAPFAIGDEVTKHSTIKDISWKSGKSGELCFVKVMHEYSSKRGLAIREYQDLVYREAAAGPTPIADTPSFVGVFDAQWSVQVNTVMLFRYSAITFNGHRIHYDEPYATNIERYRGLVIHGPMQATLMLNLASSIAEVPLTSFSYRGVAPATGAQNLVIGASVEDKKTELSVVSSNGVRTMIGSAEW